MRGGRKSGLAWVDARLPPAPVARWLALRDAVISRIVADQLSESRAAAHTALWRTGVIWAGCRRCTAWGRTSRPMPTSMFSHPARFPADLHHLGEQNRILSARAGARLDETLHPHTRIQLTECGHLPMVEDPETVTNIITTFLSSPEVRPFGATEHPVKP
ncbi:hypothetical protein AB0L63_31225 [Nocardia sp. NPDC051990]|uniref:alpha/beta fold hydrolase n=1 Tax=Nocardia sp. NPDC051990 TaxID=3155285 RepID=UPI0034395C4A